MYGAYSYGYHGPPLPNPEWTKWKIRVNQLSRVGMLFDQDGNPIGNNEIVKLNGQMRATAKMLESRQKHVDGYCTLNDGTIRNTAPCQESVEWVANGLERQSQQVLTLAALQAELAALLANEPTKHLPVAPVAPFAPVVVAPPPAEPVHQATKTVPREPEGPQYAIDLQDMEGGIAHLTQKLQRTDLTSSQRAMSESTLGALKARKDLFVADPSLFLVPDPAMMETDAGMATVMLRGLHLEVRILDLALAKGYFSPQAYQTAMKELDEFSGSPAQAATEAQELGFPPALVSQIIALKAEIAAKAMGKVTKAKNGAITISKKKPNYLLWGLGALVLFRVMR